MSWVINTLTSPSRIISNPKPARDTACDDADKTVVFQFGRGTYGQTAQKSYLLEVRRYMTKQQREMCDDSGDLFAQDQGQDEEG